MLSGYSVNLFFHIPQDSKSKWLWWGSNSCCNGHLRYRLSASSPDKILRFGRTSSQAPAFWMWCTNRSLALYRRVEALLLVSHDVLPRWENTLSVYKKYINLKPKSLSSIKSKNIIWESQQQKNDVSWQKQQITQGSSVWIWPMHPGEVPLKFPGTLRERWGGLFEGWHHWDPTMMA